MAYFIKRKKLNILERIYIFEIFRGLWITSGHFFSNLFLHILHLFGIARKKRAGATYQYPEDKRPLAPRARTRHRLTQRENGTARCVACMMCETICPARCIRIVAEEDPDPKIEKRPKSFEIDLGKCVYCGLCVEACPVDAIRMDTQILEISSYSRDAMQFDKAELLNPRTRTKETVPSNPSKDPLI